jgi:hypothetical protein
MTERGDLTEVRLEGLAPMAEGMSNPSDPVHVNLVLDATAADRIATWGALWPGREVTPGGVVECAPEVLQRYLWGVI